METEIQDNNPDSGFHEAALLLNRLFFLNHSKIILEMYEAKLEFTEEV